MSETAGPAPIARHVAKPDAVAAWCRASGVDVPSDGPDLYGVLARLPYLSNRDLVHADSGSIAEAAHNHYNPPLFRWIAPPVFVNGRPDWFAAARRIEESPAFSVLELRGGAVVQIARAPVIVAADGRTVVRDASSRYAPLVHAYDIDIRQALNDARRVSGAALVVLDDIHPLNYSHWLLDELPRLGFLGESRDVTLVVPEERRSFKRDSIRLCGFAEERVIHLGDFRAVRADMLLVPRDIVDIPHPAHKAAPWVLDFLRNRIGFAALASHSSSAMPVKLYISRADASGRRVLNEDALMNVLAPAGYERVMLADRTLAEQVALFARATHVVGLHGAGLANFAFAPQGSRLLEIFPRTYGTPAYYVLAAGQGCGYAVYVADDVVAGDRPQTDDVLVDVADFERLCGPLL